MKTTLKHLGLLAALLAGCRGREPAQSASTDAIITARTLGLAYLRDGQLAQAESAFQKVIDMAPAQALGYANLGLVYLRQGRYEDAEREIKKAAGLDTTSDDIALMLATVYRLTERPAEARHEVDRVLRRSPTDARALYTVVVLSPDSAALYLGRIVDRTPANIAARLELIDVLLAQGAADSAAALLEGLERQLPELPHEATRYFQQALAQARAGHASAAAKPESAFHHLMQTTAAYQAALEHLRSANGVLVGYPILTFSPNMGSPAVGTKAVATAVRFADVTAAAGLDAVAALSDSGDQAFAVGDYDGNGSPDVFIGGRLFRNDLGRSVDVTTSAGIVLPAGDRPVAAAFGDYDNDGRLDLFVSTAHGGVLFRNVSDSTFSNTTAQAGLGGAQRAATALWLDLDHDGDLDLFLASPQGDRAYRNSLDGPFQDMTADVVPPDSPGGSSDVAFGDFDGDGHTDLLLLGQDGRVRLLHNAGQGHFSDATAASGLGAGGPAHAGAIAVGDYDNDGNLDVLVASRDGAAPVLYHDTGGGTFEVDTRGSASLKALQGEPVYGATFFDYDNDGYLDLAVAGRRVGLFHNDGAGRFQDRSAILPRDLGSARKVAAVDWDHDGDLDLIVVGADGRPHLLLNDGGNANQFVQVQLAALRTGSGKNNDFGIGSTLELRAGPLYQTRVVTGRVTHFGLGQRLKADVLRVHWPNGVSQTVYYPGTDEDVLEQQILKGSCPYLYAWDGERFSFVTDVMWRSALGMPLGIMAGGHGIASAPPYASREYMRIPGRALVPKDGRYILQITEELWETGYLDDARLLVVDHPDSLDVFLDEGFVPPTPGPATLALYPVAHPRLPVAATDEHGNDWRQALLARDDRYVAPLEPTRYQGIATPHDLVLDFGDLSGMDSVYLFLSGWIFPTDASINLSLAHGTRPGVTFPYLEVKDRAGAWRRVADVGFPSGKSKTVIVNLTGKFLSSDRRVRIRTNMEIYWDQAFVAARGPVTSLKVTTLDPIAADLHYRGFSTQYRKGGRYGPQWPDYAKVTRKSPWEPIVGDYTRYGDVLPLLGAADDRYAVTAPGDEITLQFASGGAGPLPPGWTRDFVLYTDAWLKDADRNTAAGGTVGPLPFHAMSHYPYGPNEAYPADPVHRRYIAQFNTRHVGRVGVLQTP